MLSQGPRPNLFLSDACGTPEEREVWAIVTSSRGNLWPVLYTTNLKVKKEERGGAVVAHKAHVLKVVGSNPTPA